MIVEHLGDPRHSIDEGAGANLLKIPTMQMIISSWDASVRIGQTLRFTTVLRAVRSKEPLILAAAPGAQSENMSLAVTLFTRFDSRGQLPR